MPLRAIREQIASAFDLIVHLGRLQDGSRKVVQIAEVQGMEGDTLVMQDIFQFVQTTVEDGKVQGYFTPTGVRPKFCENLESAGLYHPTSNVYANRAGAIPAMMTYGDNACLADQAQFNELTGASTLAEVMTSIDQQVCSRQSRPGTRDANGICTVGRCIERWLAPWRPVYRRGSFWSGQDDPVTADGTQYRI